MLSGVVGKYQTLAEERAAFMRLLVEDDDAMARMQAFLDGDGEIA